MRNYILRYLLLKIQSNEWKIGDILPSEGQLSIKFNCNRNTVRSALIMLRSKNIILPINGVGNKIINNMFTFFNIYDKIVNSSDKLKKSIAKKTSLLIDKSINPNKLLETKYIDLNDIVGIKQTEFINKEVYLDTLQGNSDEFSHVRYAKQGICIFRVVENVDIIINNKNPNFRMGTPLVRIFQELYDDNGNMIEKSVSLIEAQYYSGFVDFSYNH